MEVKTPLFKRVAPGDRWIDINSDPMTAQKVHPSLTSAIEFGFQETGIKQYFIDAGEGIVYSVGHVLDPAPQKFSIYGDY